MDSGVEIKRSDFDFMKWKKEKISPYKNHYTNWQFPMLRVAETFWGTGELIVFNIESKSRFQADFSPYSNATTEKEVNNVLHHYIKIRKEHNFDNKPDNE